MNKFFAYVLHPCIFSLQIVNVLGFLIRVYFKTIFRRLLDAEVEFRNSLFADDVFNYLKGSLKDLGADGIPQILCYGLGSFSNSRSSKYQLALLLSLKNCYSSQIHIYDRSNFYS